VPARSSPPHKSLSLLATTGRDRRRRPSSGAQVSAASFAGGHQVHRLPPSFPFVLGGTDLPNPTLGFPFVYSHPDLI
jgi:hypothetical protein